MVLVLAAQALTGIATVFLDFPLTIAVLHNAGAALLVVLVTMLNYKVQYQLASKPQFRDHPAAAPAGHS
jgi:cytochrome c oxidase assembly protein subunit 15